MNLQNVTSEMHKTRDVYNIIAQCIEKKPRENSELVVDYLSNQSLKNSRNATKFKQQQQQYDADIKTKSFVLTHI